MRFLFKVGMGFIWNWGGGGANKFRAILRLKMTKGFRDMGRSGRKAKHCQEAAATFWRPLGFARWAFLEDSASCQVARSQP